MSGFMFNGKMKAITFSYDDGVTQDIRLVELFNKYNIKATFNINSGLLGVEHSLIRNDVKVNHTRVKKEDLRYVYDGHEIAAHTLTHPRLPDLEDDKEIIRQVEEDRIALSEIAGYEVKGMAYPGGGINCDERVANLIKNNTPVKYARSIEVTGSFEPYKNLFQYKGTLYHHGDWDVLFETGKRFLELKAESPQIMYIWGHSYEFDIYPERWALFEEFLKMISNQPDIYYGTNIEILG